MTERQLFGALLLASFVVAVVVFVALRFVTAPYGRHARAGWGPSFNATLAWIVMESPAPLGMAALFVLGDRPGDPAAIAFLVLWELHYLHRTYVFPLRRRGGGRRTPLLIVLFALVFNCLNAYLNGRWLFAFGPRLGAAWLVDPRFLAGAAIFLVGLAVNVHADEVLRRLRARGASGYGVPEGGLYRWISCPNYLGEVLEWCGWALATFSVPGLLFAVWTAANLVPRARSHHEWYRKTFPGYPAERRAIIPFVW
jgi:3-oxo-5-alpha-steroid 4-dehydrogenase 1